MKKNGFTLIELVVVIVILGILAAIAAPKFMDLQSDARISAINGLSGAVKSAVNMSFAKSIIQGTDKVAKYCGNGKACPGEATEVFTMYGIPAASAKGIVDAMQNGESFSPKTAAGACDAESEDWCVYSIDATNKVIVFAPKSSVGLAAAGDYSVETDGTVKAATGNGSCALVYSVTPNDTTKSTKFSVAVLKGGC